MSGAPSGGWADTPTLTGRFVRLESLSTAHAAGLARHFDPDVYRFHSRGGPQDASVAAHALFVDHMNAEPGRSSWAIRVGEDVAGRISYSELRPAHRTLEIGTTVFPAYQGGFVNPEAKLLLLERAFETLGAVRVQFKTDARNARSQRALEKLGAVREGVLRRYQTRPDGFVRDSVVYSITDDEWPTVKPRLQARLDALASIPG